MTALTEYIFTAWDYYRPGGIIMILIVIISLWMWGLILDRIIFFRLMGKKDLDLKTALGLLKEKTYSSSTTGICSNMMKGFLKERTGNPDLDKNFLEQHAMSQKQSISRSLSLIIVLSATAPMMGLLGTVTGMVSTFDVISIFGTGNAKALSGGISEALITTQSGLLVGIPGLFMGRLLKQRAERLRQRLNMTVMALNRSL